MIGTIHAPGDMVGDRYQVENLVGRGGMQEVYAATDKLFGRRVALKVPMSTSAEKRFKRSAVLSARINHANVAKTLDYLEESGRFYLIEELVIGCNLSEFLKDVAPRLDPYGCARVFHHLAKGLAASHHVDVVHRDLKPNNVMVDGARSFGDLKITDFGIAKMAEAELAEAVEGGDQGLTNSQTALGAVPYMAPEMIDDFRNVGKPADVWSLGAMMFELLTGEKPFGNGFKALKKIEAGELPPLPQAIRKSQFAPLVDSIHDVITKTISLDPAARPTADQLVIMCEALCYTSQPREFGVVHSVEYNRYGFIRPEDGSVDVFYHVDSMHGCTTPVVGQRVWFSRHPGTPRARAFPVVLAR